MEIKDVLINELSEGRAIGHTTDTVFGLMISFNVENTKVLNQLKNRPEGQPLQVLVNNIGQLEAFIKDTGKIGKIEPRTSYIVEGSNIFNKHFTSFNNSIMFRIVENDSLKKIIKQVGPLFATSANLSGQETLTSWEEVERTFKVKTNKENQVTGKASKIISLLEDEPKVIREG